MKAINVFAPFNGIGGAFLALRKARIPVNKYYSSETDTYANQCNNFHFPRTKQLGNIERVKEKNFDSKIDLVIGGSPCQGFSHSGLKANFKDPRSRLFFEFVRLVNTLQPKYFFLENVPMKKEYQDVITELLKVEPIEIDSNLFSAQNRNRLYWTNIPVPGLPKAISTDTIKDVQDKTIDDESVYLSPTAIKGIDKRSKDRKRYLKIYQPEDKSKTIMASYWKGCSNQNSVAFMDKKGLRFITPEECEALQGFPKKYTSMLSKTQRYKTLGNAFQVDTVTHLLKGLR